MISEMGMRAAMGGIIRVLRIQNSRWLLPLIFILAKPKAAGAARAITTTVVAMDIKMEFFTKGSLEPAIHLLSLGKVPGWIEWWKTFNQPFPPGAFTTTTFCVLVLMLKVVDLIVHGDSLAGETREKDITAAKA